MAWIIAACATPDSLGMLLAVSAALMAVANRPLLIVCPLALLAVLARPDAIFIFVILFCGLAWLQRKDGRAPGLLLCAFLVSALFFFLNSQALPWPTLFRHTFFGRQPYPSLLAQPVSVAEYLGVVKRTLPHVASLRTLFFLCLGCLLAIVPWLRSRAVTPTQLLAAIAVVNMVAHYLIFPIDEFGHERLFLSSYFLVIAALMLTLQAAWAQKMPKSQSCNS